MSKLMLFLVAVAIASYGAGQALAHPAHTKAPTKVTIVMHDPGCHWFSVNGAFKTTLAVKGPASVGNYDEAAVKIVGPSRTVTVAIGKHVTLAKGVYRITMVGQAPDDNHLKLTVS
jgi:hypothetical protein